ncbi:Fe-S oxidoreductase, partial [Streptomyces xanthophaeus]
MQLAAIIVSLALEIVGFALLFRAVGQLVRYFSLGQSIPPGTRTNNPYQRSVTLVKEFLGHTRMNRWGISGVAHWFVAIGFYTLLITLVGATGQLFQPDWVLPFIGHWLPFELVVEVIGTLTVVGILVLIVIRQLSRPSGPGRKSRFSGSKTGQAYFIETIVLTVSLCIMTLRGLEGALAGVSHWEPAYFFSYPMVAAFSTLDVSTVENVTYFVAMVKISVSMIWMIVISLNTNMGVAWHRFLGFPNIWFKRNADGASALGAL